MSPIEFGRCLDCLLTSLGISNNRLAKVINVDSSLVNRWVNGKRIPAYNSMYIENIAEFLAENVKNSLQFQYIEDFFEKVLGTKDNSIKIEDMLKRILYEAQGYSLELHKHKKAESKSPRNKRERVAHLQPALPPMAASHHLSSEDTILHGTHSIIATCNQMLDLAARSSQITNQKIYMTYFNELVLDKKDHAEMIRFQNSLILLMQKGWEVHFLVKISDNNNRTINLINFTKPLISTGKFFIYYVNHYDHNPIGKDYFILSECCAFACFMINYKNNSIFLRTPAAVKLYREYVENLIYHSQPLLTYYSNLEDIDYNSGLADCDNSIGNRFLYKDCFGVITFPVNLYKQLLKKRKLSTSETSQALTFYEKRLKAFLHNVGTYEHYDIYQIDSINHLIRHRQIYLYDHTGVNPVQLEIGEIIQLLENIVHLLSKHHNYHIAFLAGKSNQSPLDKRVYYCMVKEKKSIFLATFDPTKNETILRLSIEEPMVVYAFEFYFKRLWQKVSPMQKNKRAIIGWLQREIELLCNMANP